MAVRAVEHETCSCRLKCRDRSGRIYYVPCNHDAVRISSSQADGVPAPG
ncbi:hypothetical protein [Methanoculleus taiwanensis]|nr:hypothetical protein [Methanoculleus taiwanensis]